MDRARLSLLAVCALLTTTINPFADRNELVSDANHAVSSLPAVASGPVSDGLDVDEDELLAARFPAEDHALIETIASALDHAEKEAKAAAVRDAKEVAAILKRLTIRHTALPARERIALAHAIVREAKAHNLEPSLVVSVIEVESAGYHLAVSHVGAMGLMQLLPATAEELAHKHDVEWRGPDTLFDPEVNVKLGTAYLRQLTDQFGSVSTALAAYNWGPGRINRRLKRGATVPSIYIEQVRAAQSRNTTLASARS
ncbi:MAG: transglycosylase SLT domain-containing protein [Myxococcota bacterium]